MAGILHERASANPQNNARKDSFGLHQLALFLSQKVDNAVENFVFFRI
ncbi:MAG: hypothetical protein PUF80_00610 [Firmicutes bacterium]|nr:hypothetical protein [Bacillota bacterium]